MNSRTTIVLVVLLLAVGSFLYFTRDQTDSQKENTHDVRKLVDLEAADVNKLTIMRAGGVTFTLSRAPATAQPKLGPAVSPWLIDQPAGAYADGYKASDLLTGLTGAMTTAEVPAGSNPADFGLDQPQLKVKLETSSKSSVIDIGHQQKVGNGLYVQVEGDKAIEVVNGDLLTSVDVKPEDLRLSRLIDASSANVQGIQIKSPRQTLTLTHKGPDWEISQNDGATATTLPADATEVSNLISTASSAQAAGFADATDNVATLMARSDSSITFSPTSQPADTGAVTLEIGQHESLATGANQWVRLAPGGVVAKIPSSTVTSLIKTALDLRDKNLVKIDPESIDSITITRTMAATTRPTTRPAIVRTAVMSRKQLNLVMGPPVPQSQPTTIPATLASTEPASQPSVQLSVQPTSKWQMDGALKQDADDTRIGAVLSAFNPLRVDKFVAEPASRPANMTPPVTFDVTLASKSVPPLHFTFSDSGESSTIPIGGTFNGVNFEVPRSLITALDVEFVASPNKPAAAAPAIGVSPIGAP